MDFLTSLAKVAQGIIPILTTVASVFFPEVTIAGKVLNALPGFIAAAEQLFEGAGQGAVKKEYVLALAESAATGVAAVSTGGQADTWAKLVPLVGGMVDAFVAAANAVSPGTIVDTTGATVDGAAKTASLG